MPQAWNPTPASPISMVSRSHTRASQRSRRFGATAAFSSKAAPTGGRVTGANIALFWKAPRKCSNAASPLVPSSPRPLSAASARPAGMPNSARRLMARRIAHPFRRGAKQPRQQDRHRGTDRRAIEQVLPVQPPRPFQHVPEMKAGAGQAGRRGRDGDRRGARDGCRAAGRSCHAR